jgi:trigger factor
MVVAEGASLGDGDFAIIDFDGYVDGVAFPGGEGKAYPLQIGSNTFIPGFEEQLLGAKAGDEQDVKVTFPQEYHAAELAGKEAIFKVKIQDVKRKELPELDDEFAKDASEFSSLEELKADIRNKLERAAADKAEREFRSAAIKLAVENATVEVPDVMVEDRIDNMIEDLDVNLQNKGMKLDKYLEYVQMDLATLRKNYQAAALMNVKTDLLLEAVAKAEALEVKPEDMQAEIVSMAEAYGTSPQEVGKIISEQGRIATLAESVLRKKAAQLIIDTIEQG